MKKNPIGLVFASLLIAFTAVGTSCGSAPLAPASAAPAAPYSGAEAQLYSQLNQGRPTPLEVVTVAEQAADQAALGATSTEIMTLLGRDGLGYAGSVTSDPAQVVLVAADATTRRIAAGASAIGITTAPDGRIVAVLATK